MKARSSLSGRSGGTLGSGGDGTTGPALHVSPRTRLGRARRDTTLVGSGTTGAVLPCGR